MLTVPADICLIALQVVGIAWELLNSDELIGLFSALERTIVSLLMFWFLRLKSTTLS